MKPPILDDDFDDDSTKKEQRLTHAAYAILGMVALRGPSTTYEIHRALSRTIGWIWPVTQTHLYQESRGLAKLGYLSVEEEDAGRRRRVYSLTPDGSEILKEWLLEPVDRAMEIRDLAQVKLLFSELVSESDVVRLAEAQAKHYEDLLVEVRQMEERYRDRPGMSRRLSPIRHGLLVYEAAMKFWRDIAENPPRD